MMAAERRYSLPPYTRGWFQVGWSRELAVGDVKPVHQFGLELVMFRGRDGRVGLLDATCPHLGANLACGGTVRDNCVVCPYHHWSFDQGGRCTAIPHAVKIPPNARVHAWPVVERYGMIFVYRDRARGAPPYPLPAIEDFDVAEWSRPATHDWRVRIHGQDIMENSVDSAHFAAVHGHRLPVNTFIAEGKELRISQQTEVSKLGLHIRTKLEFHMIEPGFHYLRFRDTPGTQAMVFSSIYAGRRRAREPSLDHLGQKDAHARLDLGAQALPRRADDGDLRRGPGDLAEQGVPGAPGPLLVRRRDHEAAQLVRAILRDRGERVAGTGACVARASAGASAHEVTAGSEMLALALVVAALLGGGCGGGAGGAGDAGTSLDLADGGGVHPSGTVSTPTEHRPNADPCPPRPPTNGCMGGGSCATDADCTAGQNGRCDGGGIVVCACTYDQCNHDGDCGSGQACACRVTVRSAPTGSGPNSCVPANCRTDADCGPGGFCSPSYTADYCQSYVDGYYCHTASDECGTNADCVADEGGYAVCAYQPTLGHWACVLGPVCAG